MEDKLFQQEIIQKYNQILEIWPYTDLWHQYTYRMIKEYLQNEYHYRFSDEQKNCRILNAGSAGNSYSLPESHMIHIDIAEQKLLHLKNSIIGNIEAIPLDSNIFDLIICVGSVINYCDPMPVFTEFFRLLKNQGILILEYENSKTLELICHKQYNKNIVFRKTFYDRKEEKIWYYSESYINRIADDHGFWVVRTKRFHILSSLILQFCGNGNVASRFSIFDRILRMVPFIRLNSSNVVSTFYKE